MQCETCNNTGFVRLGVIEEGNIVEPCTCEKGVKALTTVSTLFNVYGVVGPENINNLAPPQHQLYDYYSS